MSKVKPIFFLLAIPLLSIVMHYRIFSTDLIGIHVWRQTQTQINIQNFYREDFNILNPRNNNLGFSADRIMRFEFPIMQWGIAGMHKIIGESIMITRVCMFIIGLWGILGFYFLLKWLWGDDLVAWVGAFAFTFSPVFYYYTMNPIPDVMALSSTCWFIAFYVRYMKSGGFKDIMVSAFFLSLATAAKLPYLMFGAMVGVHSLQLLAQQFTSNFKRVAANASVFVTFLFPVILWYKIVIPTWGSNGVLKGIFDNQMPMARTIEIFKYHLTDLLPQLLLNYGAVAIFALGLIFVVLNKTYRSKYFLPFLSLGLMPVVYFLLEYNMIDTIHDYYMMPFLPALFIVIAYGFKNLLSNGIPTRSVALLSLVSLPFFSFRAVNHFWTVEQSYFNPDILNNRFDLRRLVPDNEPCIMLNDESNFIFSYMVNKKGYIFRYDELPVEWVADMVNNKGVKYMYSDSRKIDENPLIRKYFESMLLERGSVRVFKLRKG